MHLPPLGGLEGKAIARAQDALGAHLAAWRGYLIGRARRGAHVVSVVDSSLDTDVSTVPVWRCAVTIGQKKEKFELFLVTSSCGE